eukprot:6192452-Pleurochrysis_carterae.AAC.1
MPRMSTGLLRRLHEERDTSPLKSPTRAESPNERRGIPRAQTAVKVTALKVLRSSLARLCRRPKFIDQLGSPLSSKPLRILREVRAVCACVCEGEREGEGVRGGRVRAVVARRRECGGLRGARAERERGRE